MYLYLFLGAWAGASVSAGSPLWEILAAGEWSSPAFLKYMDIHQLEANMVLQSHMDDSDCDEEL